MKTTSDEPTLAQVDGALAKALVSAVVPKRVRARALASEIAGGEDHDVLQSLPNLLTTDETAGVLRTSKKAIYAMVERGQIPGVIRIGRRVLFQQDVLVEWLRRKSKPSLER